MPPDVQHPGLKRIGVRPSLLSYVRDAWRQKDFAYTVAIGQLRAQNQDTLLGQAWHLLNPLFLAGVYYFIFGLVLQRSSGANYPDATYVAFLTIGIFTFFFSQKVMAAGSSIVVGNSQLIQNINFPRMLLPAASVIQETVAQMTAIVAMLGIVWLTGSGPKFGWLWLVPLLAVQTVWNLGLALIFARMTFHFRDWDKLLPYLLRIWFYMSGIFFGLAFVEEQVLSALPNSFFGEWIVRLYALNPMYGFVKLSRDAVLLGGTSPWYWRNVLLASAVVLIVGVIFFRRKEHEYSRV